MLFDRCELKTSCIHLCLCLNIATLAISHYDWQVSWSHTDVDMLCCTPHTLCQSHVLKKQTHISLCFRGLLPWCTSKQERLSKSLLSSNQTDIIFVDYRSSEPVDMTVFADHLAGNYVPNSVIVDATASEAPAQMYLEWMQKGIHIITPNKKLNSGPLDQFRALKQFQRESYIHYLYEVSNT